MDYEEFDIGNFEDEVCVKIMSSLVLKPMTANQLAEEIFDEDRVHIISPKLQKLKGLGMISNVKDKDKVCYWGALKKYR